MPSSASSIATAQTLYGAGLYLLCIFSGQGDCFPSFLLIQFEFNHKISSPRPMKFYIYSQTIYLSYHAAIQTRLDAQSPRFTTDAVYVIQLPCAQREC